MSPACVRWECSELDGELENACNPRKYIDAPPPSPPLDTSGPIGSSGSCRGPELNGATPPSWCMLALAAFIRAHSSCGQ